MHDVFHHVGDQMREVSVLERDRRHKKLNRETLFKSNVDFYLELTGGDMIQKFLDRENQARLEQEVLKIELEELVDKQEKICQKISDEQINEYREQKFQEKFSRVLEKARAEHAGDLEAAASIDVDADAEDDEGVPNIVIGMKPGVVSTGSTAKEARKQTPDEMQLEKLHKQIFLTTNLLNRSAQRIWQVCNAMVYTRENKVNMHNRLNHNDFYQICEYKRFEFLRLENELRSFLQETLITSFCDAMCDDLEPYIEGLSCCEQPNAITPLR